MKSAKLLLVLGCLGAMLACGDLGDDDGAPLAVIEGQLSTQSALESTPSNVRVAVIWSTSTTGFKTSMDVPASPVFPSKFRLELRDPPPTTAMVRPSEMPEPDPTTDHPGFGFDTQSRPLNNQRGSGAYAIGTVVAYEDLDGDGSLGLIDANTPPRDRVLGTNEELLVVYVEGDVDTFETPPPKGGYNLYHSPRCTRGEGSAPAVCPPGSWLPTTTPYELPLTADPQLAEKMCNAAGTEVFVGATKVHGPAPAPGPKGWPERDDPRVKCGDDGKSYSYFECIETSQGLCKGTYERCDQYKWTLPSETPPPEWPCTIK